MPVMTFTVTDASDDISSFLLQIKTFHITTNARAKLFKNQQGLPNRWI